MMVNGPALKVLIEEEFGESCPPSISTWRWNASLIPKGIGSKSPCRENSCRTNITARVETCQPTGTRRNRSPRMRAVGLLCQGLCYKSAAGTISCENRLSLRQKAMKKTREKKRQEHSITVTNLGDGVRVTGGGIPPIV